MPNIIYSPTAQLVQVEDFPDGCERTVKGALYVRPGATAIVSSGEAAHLKAKGVVFSVLGPKVPLTPPVGSKPKPATPVVPLTGLGFPQAPVADKK